VRPNERFFRHDGICRPMDFSFLTNLGRSTAPRPGSAQAAVKDAPEVLRPTHRRDEYRPAIPQRVARQQSPPPLHRQAHPKTVPGSATTIFQRTVNSVLTVCLSPGDNPTPVSSTFIEAGLTNLIPEHDSDVTVRVYLCRDRDTTIRQVLHPHSLVVIGTETARFGRRTLRLARLLKRDGHEVILSRAGSKPVTL